MANRIYAALPVLLAFPQLAQAQTDAPAPDVPAEAAIAQTSPSFFEVPGLQLKAFADAGFTYNSNRPQDQAAANLYHGFDVGTGFGVVWAGLDSSYTLGPGSLVLDLRVGPGASLFAGPDAAHNLEYVKQLYVSLAYAGFRVDFGKMNTPVGAEVAESWLNANYTRGLLCWLAQPFFHTGLRASYTFEDVGSVGLYLVNGWNNSIDNNAGKTFGANISLGSAGLWSASFSYFVGPEQPDMLTADDGTTVMDNDANGRLRHLADVVLSVTPVEGLTASLNGDFGIESTVDGESRWYGLAVVGRYQFLEQWAAAARGEVVVDPQGFLTAVKNQQLWSGTATLEYAPIEAIILRLEGRVDRADSAIFPTADGSTTRLQPTFSFGLVGKTS
jgi:hypothetical protein